MRRFPLPSNNASSAYEQIIKAPQEKTRFKNAFGWSRFCWEKGVFRRLRRRRSKENHVSPCEASSSSRRLFCDHRRRPFPRWGKQDSQWSSSKKKEVSTGGPSRQNGKRRAVVVLAAKEAATEEVNTTRTRRRRSNSRDGSARRRSSPRWFRGEIGRQRETLGRNERVVEGDEREFASSGTSGGTESKAKSRRRRLEEKEETPTMGRFNRLRSRNPLSLRGGFEANRRLGIAAGNTKKKEEEEEEEDPRKRLSRRKILPRRGNQIKTCGLSLSRKRKPPRGRDCFSSGSETMYVKCRRVR